MTDEQLHKRINIFANKLEASGASKEAFLKAMATLVLERVSKKLVESNAERGTHLLAENTELLDKIITEELQKASIEFCK